jgi:hypothetical protein
VANSELLKSIMADCKISQGLGQRNVSTVSFLLEGFAPDSTLTTRELVGDDRHPEKAYTNMTGK